MPTDTSQERSLNYIVKDIIEGNYKQYLNNTGFEKFLSSFLFIKASLEKQTLLNNLLENDFLKNIFNYFGDYIYLKEHKISENDSIKLLQFLSDCIALNQKKVLNNDYTFTENFSNAINSYFYFVGEFLQIPNVRTVEIEQITGKNVFVYSKFLLKSIIKLAPNAQNSTTTNQTKAYNYDITDPLNSFVKGAGNLILKLRNQEESYDYIEASVIDLINEATIKVKPTELSSLRYNFLSQYHQGYSDIEQACQQLFNTTECYPYNEKVNQQFQLITQGNPSTSSTNSSGILEQLLFGSKESRSARLKDFSITKNKNNKLSNLLDYFKKNINETNEQSQDLPADFVRGLSTLFVDLKGIFSERSPRPKVLNKSLSLFLTLLKNPSIGQHNFHLWPALSASADQVKSLLINYKGYSASHNTDINTSLRIFSDILHSINNINGVIIPYNQQINAIVKELSQKCLQLNICDSFATLNQFSKNLGTMARRLFIIGKVSDAELITKNVKAIIKDATNKVSVNQLKGIAWTFLNQYHDKNATLVATDCERLFNLTDCQEYITANITTEQATANSTIPIPETTPIPTTTTSTAAPLTVNTTTALATNQTTPAVTVDHSVVTELPGYSNITTFNQTGNFEETSIVYPVSLSELPSTTEIINDIVQNVSSRLPSTTEISITAVHGVGSGLINILAQAIPDWLRRNGYVESRTPNFFLRLAGGILHAICEASFLLMLAELNALVAEGNEEQAHTLWEKMAEILPAFVINLGMRPGLHLLNYLCEKFLPKILILKGLIQSIPTLSSLWSFSRNPILFGIHAATAYAVSAVGLFGFNRYFRAKNHRPVDLEAQEITVELQSLDGKENVKPTVNGTTGSKTTEETFQYITEEKFNEVKQHSENLLKQLKTLELSLHEGILNNRNEITSKTIPCIVEEYEKIIVDKKHVLKIIQDQTLTMSTCVVSLKDKIHNDADKYLKKNCYHAAMEKLGNVFKLMVTTLNNMKTELNGAKGFIEGKNQSFAEMSSILDTIKDIMILINFPLSLANIYLKKYSDSDIVEKAEKNGAKKALANHELFEKNTLNTSKNPLRSKKTRSFSDNRCRSVASDPRTHSSGSEEGSVISAGSSKDDESAQILRPLLKS